MVDQTSEEKTWQKRGHGEKFGSVSTSTSIRESLAQVAALRGAVAADRNWLHATHQVKQFQCARFAKAYEAMASDPRQGPALRFFLTDLYAPRDFSLRDAQFGRIAPAIELLFPKEVAQTAATLAQVHALSERLDTAMGKAWLMLHCPLSPDSYMQAWCSVGEPHSRERQLQAVMSLGRQLADHTRSRGLRTLLKIMRGPAGAAGLSDLQAFLENGFDTFKGLGDAEPFLQTIERQEATFIAGCFAQDERVWPLDFE